MSINQEDFGQTKDGNLVVSFTLTNDNGMIVKIINLGAAITSIKVPDKAGNVNDVVLGYDNVEGYEANDNYFGVAVGRCANRIAKGQFTLDGQRYQLDVNNGPNHLHGGSRGFGKMLWDTSVEGQTLRLTHTSPDGHSGYPGEVTTEICYQLTNENALNISYVAVTTKPTVIYLTNHSYFNLAGHNGPLIYQHRVSINADRYVPVDGATLIPTGDLCAVQDTVFDLREPVELIDRIHDVPGGGFDHCFCLNDVPSTEQACVRVHHPPSGRTLEVYTNQPGVHFYTGNFLDNSSPCKQGVCYPKHAGFCLEMGNYPDAINQPNFPKAILRTGEQYKHRTSYKFGW